MLSNYPKLKLLIYACLNLLGHPQTQWNHVNSCMWWNEKTMHDWSVRFQSGKNLMISLLNCSMIRRDCETRAHLPYSSSKSLFLWIWIIIDNHIPHWQCSFKPRISSDLPGFHFMSPKIPLPCPLPWGVLKSLAQGLSAEDTLRRLPRQLLMLYAPWPLEMRWGEALHIVWCVEKLRGSWM